MGTAGVDRVLATMPEPPPVHVPVEGVGWDIRAVPCERTDMEGRVIAPPEPLEDPRSPSLRVYDHPEVEALRAELAQNNGINGLEIFSPDDDPAEICRVYRRDGFVVVRDCLSVEQLELLRSGCSKALQMIMDVEPDAGRQIMHETGRLPHRYSYGSSAATRQQRRAPVDEFECHDKAKQHAVVPEAALAAALAAALRPTCWTYRHGSAPQSA